MRFLILIFSLFLIGCGALETKLDRSENFGEMVLNPQQIKFQYERIGDEQTYKESRCTGRLCDE